MMKRLVLMMVPALYAMRKSILESAECVIILLVLAGFTAGCSETVHVDEENGEKFQVSNVKFTPCEPTKVKSSGLLGNVDVKFTNGDVQITYDHFEVTCDFTIVNVTHTFVNGVLNITQQGSPNQARCICYTDVSCTINGISQNEVNVIFINGVQVYCHNDAGNEDEYGDLEGMYAGTFTVRYASDVPEWWFWGSESGKTTLELKNGKFTCAGNPDRIPAGGSGNYSVKNKKIIFEDVNSRTADFDWNLILNGEYEYTFDGKRLKFSAFKNDVGHYEYDLEKESESNCDKDVIISQTGYRNAPDEYIEIIDMKINGNCLKIQFSASGCSGSSWNVKLIGWGDYDKSYPPQTTLRLSLDNKEICHAVITKEVSFNLEPLLEFFQHHATNQLYLNISGHGILYEN